MTRAMMKKYEMAVSLTREAYKEKFKKKAFYYREEDPSESIYTDSAILETLDCYEQLDAYGELGAEGFQIDNIDFIIYCSDIDVQDKIYLLEENKAGIIKRMKFEKLKEDTITWINAAIDDLEKIKQKRIMETPVKIKQGYLKAGPNCGVEMIQLFIGQVKALYLEIEDRMKKDDPNAPSPMGYYGAIKKNRELGKKDEEEILHRELNEMIYPYGLSAGDVIDLLDFYETLQANIELEIKDRIIDPEANPAKPETPNPESVRLQRLLPKQITVGLEAGRLIDNGDGTFTVVKGLSGYFQVLKKASLPMTDSMFLNVLMKRNGDPYTKNTLTRVIQDIS